MPPMDTAAASNQLAAAPRQVIIATADEQVPVDLEAMRLSHTFDDMFRDLKLGEDESPMSVLSLPDLNTPAFLKATEWCMENKGREDPVIEKDPFTQECVWLVFTDYEQHFFDVPVLELLELAKTANYLDIRGLYHLCCQAVASLIKGKEPIEVRRILHQRADFTSRDYAEISAGNPWHDAETVVHDPLGDVLTVVDILPDVLVTIFEKLPREDLERLQLVNIQFRNVITLSKELSCTQGPLRAVHKVVLGGVGVDSMGLIADGLHRIILRADDDDKYNHYNQNGGDEKGWIVCSDHATLVERLQFCAVQELGFPLVYKVEDQLLERLIEVKSAWKNAVVRAETRNFSTKKMFELAFRELLLCKEIRLFACEKDTLEALGGSKSFMQLPAVLHCNKLDISRLPWLVLHEHQRWLDVSDVIAWIEHYRPHHWHGPKQLEIAGSTVKSSLAELLDALKKAFFAAKRPNPYTVRVSGSPREVQQEPDLLENKVTGEKLRIRLEEHDMFVECK